MILRNPAGRKRDILLVFQTNYVEAPAILRGIANYGASHGDWVTFLDDRASAERHRDWLECKPWDGAINLHTTPEFAGECRRLRVPLVDLCDRPSLPGVHQIRPDNVAIGHMGAEHFIERGHRNFGFCGYSDLEWSVERRRGFAEGVGLAGFPCAFLEQPIFSDHNAPDWEQNLMVNIAAWIEGSARPVGIMACHDMCAIQVMRACQHLGLVVPDEVSVLGVDDDAIRCELSYPPLSSVATNRFVQGYTAAGLLDRLMSGTRVKPASVGIGPTRVEVRQSSDILAIRDNTMASALGFIRDNACNGITVANVARHVAVSRSQLEKKFRQHIGRSPKCEIFKVQMAKAKQLLVETDLPLKRITGLVGFEHPEYLSVVFKRHTKVPPGTYRRNAQARV